MEGRLSGACVRQRREVQVVREPDGSGSGQHAEEVLKHFYWWPTLPHLVTGAMVIPPLLCYPSRLEWLSRGSRELFGEVLEERVYILVDTSESMKDQLPLLKDKIHQLMRVRNNLFSHSVLCGKIFMKYLLTKTHIQVINS